MQLSHFIVPGAVARAFYAIAIIVFGVQQFIFGYMIAGRPRLWPENTTGQNIVAYLSALVFVACGFTILIKSKSKAALIVTALIIFLAAALPNLYFVISTLHYGGVLTNLGKSLTLSSGALLVAKSLSDQQSALNSQEQKFISLSWICRYFTGCFLLIGGIQHFIFAEFVKFLIPTWILGAEFWTLFAGVALIAAGIGLLTGIKLKLAATLAGWMVFAWVFLLHLPLAISNPVQNEWTAVFEALSVSGILFLIARDSEN